MNSRLALVSVALSLAACQDCFSEVHVATAMRVLGTTVDPPAADPGGTVTVRVVTVDVTTRPVVVRWWRCPALLTDLSAVPSDPTTGTPMTSAVIDRCLATGAFADGLSVSVPIDALGGTIDPLRARAPRRWTDLLGFACADGTIEAPPASGTWPRCTGTRGVLFSVSIPGPKESGENPVPPQLSFSHLGVVLPDDTAVDWTEDAPLVVDHCVDSSCPALTIYPSIPGFDNLQAVVPGAFEQTLGMVEEGTPILDTAFISYVTTDAAPPTTDSCSTGIDPQPPNAFAWRPPTHAGDVSFWFTARTTEGGLVVAQRRARVR